MSLYGSSVEYGLHCLLYLVDPPAAEPLSSRDLAEFQGVSPSYVAKLFTQLEKAGIVESVEGLGGGYRLARPAEAISVLNVTDALEGGKPLFQCREVRGKCILYGETPPDSATKGICSIHAVMLDAERKMRAALASHTLADLAFTVAGKRAPGIRDQSDQWFQERRERRLRSSGRPRIKTERSK